MRRKFVLVSLFFALSVGLFAGIASGYGSPAEEIAAYLPPAVLEYTDETNPTDESNPTDETEATEPTEATDESGPTDETEASDATGEPTEPTEEELAGSSSGCNATPGALLIMALLAVFRRKK